MDIHSKVKSITGSFSEAKARLEEELKEPVIISTSLDEIGDNIRKGVVRRYLSSGCYLSSHDLIQDFPQILRDHYVHYDELVENHLDFVKGLNEQISREEIGLYLEDFGFKRHDRVPGKWDVLGTYKKCLKEHPLFVREEPDGSLLVYPGGYNHVLEHIKSRKNTKPLALGRTIEDVLYRHVPYSCSNGEIIGKSIGAAAGIATFAVTYYIMTLTFSEPPNWLNIGFKATISAMFSGMAYLISFMIGGETYDKICERRSRSFKKIACSETIIKVHTKPEFLVGFNDYISQRAK